MSLIIPPAKNYQSPLIALPSRLLRDPETMDGPRGIALEFDWTTMGTFTAATATTPAQTAISVNLSNNANLRFSQIVSMKIDNSQCGADVQFVFTDTQETVLIPAYTPCVIVPVFTDQTQFYAIAQGMVLSTDVTRVQVLNFVPPPATVPTSVQQNQVFTAPAFVTAGNVTVIPNTISGTLTAFFLSVSGAPAPAAYAQFNVFLNDGNAPADYLFNTLQYGVAQNTPCNYAVLCDFENLDFRFKNGLVLNTTTNGGFGGAPPVLNIIARYRTP